MKKLILSISILVLCSCSKSYTCRDVLSIDGNVVEDYTYELNDISSKEINNWIEKGNISINNNGTNSVRSRVCN